MMEEKVSTYKKKLRETSSKLYLKREREIQYKNVKHNK